MANRPLLDGCVATILEVLSSRRSRRTGDKLILSPRVENIMIRSYPLLPLWFALALAVGGGWPCRAAEPPPAADPLVYLFDAPTASVTPLPEQGLAKLQPSSGLEEDDCQHRFAGSPVLMNDKIVAVLRKDTPEVDRLLQADLRGEVLRHFAAGLRWQHRSSSAQALPSARTAAAPWRSKSSSARRGNQLRRITYELAAGAAFVKTTAGEGVERLRVKAPCRFADPARLLRRRHPRRCGGDSRRPGGTSQRELPAAHDPRWKHDRDDGVGVARRRRRRHALGSRAAADRGLRRLLWEEAADLDRGAGGSRDLARTCRCPGRRRQDDRPGVEDAVSRLVAQSTGAPPTR